MKKNKYPIPKWIWGVTLSAHLVFLSFLFFWSPTSFKKKVPIAQIKANLYVVQKPKPPAKARPRPVKKVTPTKKPVKKTQVAKVEKKPAPKPKEQPKPEPIPKKEVIATQTTNKQDLSQLPKPTEHGYQEQLQRILSSYLRLPRVGYVIIEVNVLESGKIKSIQVLDASDKEIMNTLKAQISNIRLPPFSHEFKGQKEHTFRFKFV